jgi:hypothetical protein
MIFHSPPSLFIPPEMSATPASPKRNLEQDAKDLLADSISSPSKAPRISITVTPPSPQSPAFSPTSPLPLPASSAPDGTAPQYMIICDLDDDDEARLRADFWSRKKVCNFFAPYTKSTHFPEGDVVAHAKALVLSGPCTVVRVIDSGTIGSVAASPVGPPRPVAHLFLDSQGNRSISMGSLLGCNTRFTLVAPAAPPAAEPGFHAAVEESPPAGPVLPGDEACGEDTEPEDGA